MTARKTIATRLLATLAPTGGAFATSGRRLRDPEHVATASTPALFLVKPGERSIRESGLPPRRVMEFLAVIYTDVGDAADAIPADVVDDLLDVIDAALEPKGRDKLLGGRQTLGDLVYDCVVDGDVELAPGDVQGKGTLVVPINVTLP